MAYDSPLQLLDRTQLSILFSDEHSRDLYVRGLAVLQGLLAPFSTGRMITAIWERDAARRALEEFGARLPIEVASVMRVNEGTAFDLLEVSEKGRRTKQELSTHLVDDFISDLVKQYQILRSGGAQLLYQAAGQ